MGNVYTYPDGPDGCEGLSNCPLIESPGDTGLLVLYTFWGIAAASFAAYHHMRPELRPPIEEKAPARSVSIINTMKGGKIAEMTTRKSMSDKLLESKHHENHAPSESSSNEVIQRPMRKTTLGLACACMYGLVSISLIACFMVCVVDNFYNCQIKGNDALCYYGSRPVFQTYENNSSYFFIIWWMNLCWFGYYLLFSDDIMMWFLSPCFNAEATHMYVWTRTTMEHFNGNGNKGTFFLVQWCQDMRRRFTPHHLLIGRETLVPVHGISSSTSDRSSNVVDATSRYFIFEGSRYTYDPSSGAFRMPVFDLSNVKLSTFHADGARGLSGSTASARLTEFGPNRIPYMKKTVLQFIQEEITTFFYFYQLMMFAVWLSYGSLIITVIPMLLVLGGAIASVYLQYKGQEVIMQLTSYETKVEVRRDGVIKTISSFDVVPGDIIIINKNDWIMPCDAVLIRGGCIMNESSLTGESMPVQKKSCDNDANVTFSLEGGKFANHMLFAGTTVVQQPQSVGDDSSNDKEKSEGNTLYSEAYVISTGVSTSKGQLVSSILHPEKIRFKFEDELEAVVLLLGGLAILSFIVGLGFVLSNGSNTYWTSSWISAMFTASQVFSPMLPVALKVGQIRSTERLRKVGINCLSPRHIAICGKIKIFCFDKTGTLTKEGMEFCGAIPQINSKLGVLYPASTLNQSVAVKNFNTTAQSSQIDVEANENANPLRYRRPIPSSQIEVESLDLDLPAFKTLIERVAVCHEVAVQGSNQFIGNEIDVKMFTATGWSLRVDRAAYNKDTTTTIVTSPDGRTSYQILRQFAFDHARQTMTVVVEHLATGERFVVTKGSYEKMESICSPDSITSDYQFVSTENAFQGGYVLGISHRRLTNQECPKERGNAAIEALNRGALEAPKSQQFLALLIFRNEPKPESRPVLLHLRSGGIRPVMVTGDNGRCGQYIARTCGMIDERSHILMGTMDEDKREVHWAFLEGEGAAFTAAAERTTRGNSRETEASRSTLSGGITTLSTTNLLRRIHHNGLHAEDGNRVELAISGNDVLAKLIESNHLVALLPHIRIFARMSPESKTTIIRNFRSVGYTVAMCGDGGNDCGALRAAHAGLALSDAEASVVSPFTSRRRSPTSAIDLVKEGRASLATSFATYKFLISYGLIFCFTKLIGTYYGILLSMMHFIIIDAVTVVTLLYTMTLSEPQERLSDQIPSASLLGARTVASSLGYNFIAFICMISAFGLITNDPDYVQWPSEYSDMSIYWELGDNWETTTSFLVMFSFILGAAMVFSFGYKFRKPIRHNLPLIINLASLFLIAALLMLMDSNIFTDHFHIASHAFNKANTTSPIWSQYQADGGKPSPGMSFELRLKLFFLIGGFLCLAIIWQAEVLEGSVGAHLKHKYGSKPHLHKLIT